MKRRDQSQSVDTFRQTLLSPFHCWLAVPLRPLAPQLRQRSGCISIGLNWIRFGALGVYLQTTSCFRTIDLRTYVEDIARELFFSSSLLIKFCFSLRFSGVTRVSFSFAKLSYVLKVFFLFFRCDTFFFSLLNRMEMVFDSKNCLLQAVIKMRIKHTVPRKKYDVSFSLTQKSELKKIIFILFLSKAAWQQNIKCMIQCVILKNLTFSFYEN